MQLTDIKYSRKRYRTPDRDRVQQKEIQYRSERYSTSDRYSTIVRDTVQLKEIQYRSKRCSTGERNTVQLTEI